jgi:hypothetical protein
MPILANLISGIYGHLIIFGLWCNRKKIREFFFDYDERFFLLIPEIFTKNKYCGTVKIKKKAQTSIIQIVD